MALILTRERIADTELLIRPYVRRTPVLRVDLADFDLSRTAARPILEPGSAAAFAALLSGKYRAMPDESVAVLVCGGNMTAVRFD